MDQDGLHAHMWIKPSKIFSKTKSYDIQTWHEHRGLKLCKVCINNDPGLTLAYFTARANLVAYAFEWGETVTQSFNGKKLAANEQIDRFIFLK